MRPAYFGLIALLSIVHAADSAIAKEADLQATKDNTLYQSSTGGVSNGAGDYIFAGVTGLNDTHRAVLAFDLSSIPKGSTITAVALTLYMSRTIAAAKPVSLHRTLADWGEGTSHAAGEEGVGAPSTPGDATWLHTFFNGSFWANAGGDFSAIASQTVSVGPIGSYTWPSGPSLIADVQAWVSDPPVNYGWTLVGDESTSLTSKRFNSHEYADENLRPHLRVTYQDPPIQAIGTSWGRVKALMR